MDKFIDFADYLKRDKRNDFYISLKEIEEIIGQSLCRSAYVHPTYWSTSSTHRFALVIEDCGFKVRPDLANERIRLIRISKADESLDDGLLDDDYEFKSYSKKHTKLLKVDLAKQVDKFINVYWSDPNGRYLFYDHIRRIFIEYRKDKSKLDLLTLNLYAYLASWGMLRNSFLMQKDYKFITPIVEILSRDKYDPILNYDPFNDPENKQLDLILAAYHEIKYFFIGQTYYVEGTRTKKRIVDVSDTLITKILLGTLGCVVAFDTYVRKGLSNYRLTQKVNKQSLIELNNFIRENKEEVKEILSKLNDLYTPMKVADMFFFEEGFSLD